MSNLLFFAFVHIFGCLLNQEWSIRAQEIPVKRVTEGKDSVNERFFYINMTSYFLDVITNELYSFDCGATFYSKTIVISAGHCVWRELNVFRKALLTFRDYRISHAEWRLTKKKEKPNPRIIVRPQYVFVFNGRRYYQENGNPMTPDLAVLDIGPNVYEQLKKVVILPLCSDNFFREVRTSGKLVTVVGMGDTEINNARSRALVLQEATLEVTRAQNPCKYYYEQGTYNTQHMLCAVGVSCFRFNGQRRKLAYVNKKNGCNGDSGGPLFHKYENGIAHCLIGIVTGEMPPISRGNRTLIERISPFHDGTGLAGRYTSLEKFQDFWSQKETWFISMQFVNQFVLGNEERR